MTPEEWSRLKAIFEECVDLEPDRRRGYLESNCHDPELRREVESLLESYEQSGEFIERPVLEEASAGSRIGDWEILGKIGEGGIARVYRARRAGVQFEQVAALKLLKPGIDSEEISRHFLAERRILATFNHPNIARLIDGGIAAAGRPYFVMEFVEGVSINTFVERRGLNPRQICALVRQVCDAVDYAHRRFVVHRDLKPSNVLVTEAGEAKLLDFGIAKLLSEEGARTATGIRLLTPDYASPEQIRGEPVTTASDVYSLGVMLYRLLVGKSPYRTSGSELAVAVALEREEPVKPSAAVAGPLSRELAGDLDTIAMKALDPNPAGRYASASELAADLLRYESGHPILARPQTLRYRVRKLIARNRLAAAVALVAAAAAIGGIASTLWEARVARIERLRAEKRYYDVRQLANSLLFDVHDAIESLPGATKARALVIARATEYLDRLSADAPFDPNLRLEVATAYIRLGDVHGNRGMANLGDEAKAAQQYRRALALLEPIATGGKDPRIQRALALTYTRLGGLENAQRALAIREVLARASPGDPAAANDLARSYFAMGVALVDKQEYEKALPWFGRDHDILRELLSAKPLDLELLQQQGQALKRAGAVLVMLGRNSEALESYKEALKAEELLSSLNREDAAAQMAISYSESDIALIYWRQKRYTDSIRHFQRAASIRKSLRAADPADDRARWSLWSVSARLGSVYVQAGDRRRGLEWLLQAEQLARPDPSIPEADSRRLDEWIRSCVDLSNAYQADGLQSESFHWSQRALEGCRELERRNQMTPSLRSTAAKLSQRTAREPNP